MKAKRKSFKARHAKNIKKGKMSAAYWADKVKLKLTEKEIQLINNILSEVVNGIFTKGS